MMCCPSTKVIKRDSNVFLAIGGLHENKLCDTLQAMAPTNVKMVHQTSLLDIESNPDRPALPALSATKRKNHAPIRFYQQAQVPQGHGMQKSGKL